MPIGTSNTDHLMPPSNHTSTGSNKSTGASKLTDSSSGKHLDANANSLEVVGTLVSTNSVSKLLELGEAATANTPSTNRKDSSGLAPSTKIALIRAAQEDLARIFGIPEGTAAFDDGMLTVTRVAEGEFISKEGELQPALYYILSGGFVITQIPSVAGPVSLCSFSSFLVLSCLN